MRTAIEEKCFANLRVIIRSPRLFSCNRFHYEMICLLSDMEVGECIKIL